MQTRQVARHTTLKWTYTIYAILICAWTLAWVVKVYIDDRHISWLATSAGSFTWWTLAKLILWILPAIWLIRLNGRSLREVSNVSNWKGWLAWGGGVGLFIALTGFIPKYFSRQPFLPSEFSFALFSVLVVAPIFEEFLIRGAILGSLQRSLSFWSANVVSSLLFIGLHVPGWYFMETLTDNLRKPLGGAASIFVLGLLFGYVVRRGRSVAGGMLAHFLNNLASLR